jgi:hypothetical protein
MQALGGSVMKNRGWRFASSSWDMRLYADSSGRNGCVLCTWPLGHE